MILHKKGKLNKKEKILITTLVNEIADIYSDFYITKNNLRLYVKENIHLLYDCLQKGDEISYSPEDGIAFITGWSDNAPRKYIKVLAKNEASAERLLKVVSWNVRCDVFAKVKKNNPLRKSFQSNRYIFLGDRGKEILLMKKLETHSQKKEINRTRKGRIEGEIDDNSN